MTLTITTDEGTWTELHGKDAWDDGTWDPENLDDDGEPRPPKPNPLRLHRVFGLNGALYPRLSISASIWLKNDLRLQTIDGFCVSGYRKEGDGRYDGWEESAALPGFDLVPMEFADVALELLQQARQAYAARTKDG